MIPKRELCFIMVAMHDTSLNKLYYMHQSQCTGPAICTVLGRQGRQKIITPKNVE